MVPEDKKKENIISELRALSSSLTKKGFHWEWDFTKNQGELKDPEKTLKSAVEELEKEIEQRKKVEHLLLKSKENLEGIVNERTSNLKKTNVELLKEIKQRTKVEESLRASEEKYRRLFEQSNDPILLLNNRGRILDANTKSLDLLGVEMEKLKRSSIQNLAPKFERGKIKALISETLEHGNSIDESSIQHSDGTIMDVEISSSLVDKRSGKLQSVIRNITERRRVESEMKKRLMKFDLKDRNLYLTKEKTPVLAIEAVNDLVKIGYNPVVLSRNQKEIFEGRIEGGFIYHWLAEHPSDDSVQPKTGSILRRIDTLPRKSIILIDSIEYIHSAAGHKKTVSLVHRLKDTAYFSDQIIIISVDPSMQDEQVLRILEKEALPVEMHERDRLSEDLLEVLGFVLNETIKGVKPSFTQVGVGLGMSKPTARKRIRSLITSGQLHIISKGNKKVLELTEAGNKIFQK